MDGWLVETAACCRARLAKKEGEHRGSGSLSPSSGDLGRGGVAKRPNTEISAKAGGVHSLSSRTHTGNYSSRGGKLLLHHFFPFYSPQHQARWPPMQQGCRKHPWGWFNKDVQKVLQFHRKPECNYTYTHLLSFSLAFLLSVPHCLSFPSFFSSSLPLIPFRDSKGLIQHSMGRDKLKQWGDLQVGRVLRTGNRACFTVISWRWGLYLQEIELLPYLPQPHPPAPSEIPHFN